MHLVTYRDCLVSAATFLKLEDVKTILENKTEDTAEQNAKKEIDELIECCDFVLDEIACDYVPLKKTESFKSEDLRIYYKNFSKKPIDIFAIKNGGKRVPFRVFFDSVLMPYDGRFEIDYSYTPLKGGLETKLEWDTQRVSERIVAYGIACEYCLINSMTEEAVLWDKRFKDALFRGGLLRRELRIKRRSWY